MTHSIVRSSTLPLLASGLLAGCSMFSSAPPPPPPAVAAAAAAAKAAPPAPPPVVHINTSLEKCATPIGSVVVNEDIGSIWYSQLRGYKLPSASTALRALMQQSGCFVWTDGTPVKTKSGKGSAPLKPDFTLSPSISFTDAANSAPGKSSIDAITTLTLQDNRSTVQLAETEGSASYVDFNTFSPIFSAPNAGTSAFTKSPEGRVIAASFVDAYNLLVRAARNYQQPGAKAASMPNLPDLPNKPSVTAPSVQAPSVQTPTTPSLKIK